MIKSIKALLATGTLLTGGVAAQAGTGVGNQVSDMTMLWVLVITIAVLIVVNLVLSGTIKGVASDKELWKNVKDSMPKNTAGILVIALLFSSLGASAADTASSAGFVMGNQLFYALIAMIAILMCLVFYQISILKGLFSRIRGSVEGEKVAVSDDWSALTDIVPIEREEEIMFEHEHDGIRELDNNLPPWWLYGFYLTILFAIVYPFVNIGGGTSTEDMYATEMAEAEAAKELFLAGMSNLIDETNVEFTPDESTLAAGKKVFIDNCAACHGQLGEGGVGPNMTDEFWLHGGGIKDIFKTIKYGVPTKGMIPWEAQLSPKQMQEVSTFIKNLKGTNPPNQKEAQGDLWKE